MFPTTFDQHRKFQGPGRKRRSDDENRNFVCPCGKSYFSYTALWTHTKQKHNGVVTYSIYIATQEPGHEDEERRRAQANHEDETHGRKIQIFSRN